MMNIPAETRAVRLALKPQAATRGRARLVLGAVCAGLGVGLVLALSIADHGQAAPARPIAADYPAGACDKGAALRLVMDAAGRGDVVTRDVDGVTLLAHTDTWASLTPARQAEISAAATCAWSAD